MNEYKILRSFLIKLNVTYIYILNVKCFAFVLKLEIATVNSLLLFTLTCILALLCTIYYRLKRVSENIV